MRTINSDIIHLKQRIFKSATHEQIEKTIVNKVIRITKNNNHTLESAIANLTIIDEQDIGFTLGFKYINYNESNNTLLGKQSINGFNFLGVEVSGSNDYVPVFMIFYLSNQGLKEYVPIKGNPVNLDWYSAIGSENKYYSKILHSDTERVLISEYKKRKIYNPHKSWAEMYCDKYKINILDLGYNWNSIKEDITEKFNLY